MKSNVIESLTKLGFNKVNETCYKLDSIEINLRYRSILIYKDSILIQEFLRSKEQCFWIPYLKTLIEKGDNAAEDEFAESLTRLSKVFGVE